jgi:hypothetical protein
MKIIRIATNGIALSKLNIIEAKRTAALEPKKKVNGSMPRIVGEP